MILFYSILVLLLSVDMAVPSTLSVPAEFVTIQAALDAVSEGDTVLVSTGYYPESLTAPPFFFVLQGNVSEDSSTHYPIIDPSSLPGSDSLGCLTFPPGSRAVVQKIQFLNGRQMYPRTAHNVLGGVRCASADSVVIEHCVFDSTYCGIGSVFPHAGSRIWLNGSVFTDNQWACAFAGAGGYLEARACSFSGYSQNPLVVLNSGGTISACHFHGNTDGGYLVVGGSSCTIRNCLFGPSESLHGPSISWQCEGTGLLVGNLFTGIGLHGPLFSVVVIGDFCNANIDSNRFSELQTLNLGPVNPMLFSRNPDDDSADGIVALHGNFFSNMETGPGYETNKLIRIGCNAELLRNRFEDIRPEEDFVIVVDSTAQETPFFRENIFMHNHRALKSDDVRVIAEGNYWGHATGPFHSSLNPNGRGDSIEGNVLFDPWYPDTSFLDTPIRTSPSVSRHALQVFPNPFNQTATLRFEIPEAGIFRIELFDLLGRRVKELFTGAVLFEKNIRIDGSDLASGIYYARAWQTTHNRPVATVKLALVK